MRLFVKPDVVCVIMGRNAIVREEMWGTGKSSVVHGVEARIRRNKKIRFAPARTYRVQRSTRFQGPSNNGIVKCTTWG